MGWGGRLMINMDTQSTINRKNAHKGITVGMVTAAAEKNLPKFQPVFTLENDWTVTFAQKRGGPALVRRSQLRKASR